MVVDDVFQPVFDVSVLHGRFGNLAGKKLETG
jgi:hypothetical protein